MIKRTKADIINIFAIYDILNSSSLFVREKLYNNFSMQCKLFINDTKNILFIYTNSEFIVIIADKLRLKLKRTYTKHKL